MEGKLGIKGQYKQPSADIVKKMVDGEEKEVSLEICAEVVKKEETDETEVPDAKAEEVSE